jgi:hypothetical protein
MSSNIAKYRPPEDLYPFESRLVMSSPVGRWMIMRRNLFVETTMPLATARPMPERIRDF